MEIYSKRRSRLTINSQVLILTPIQQPSAATSIESHGNGTLRPLVYLCCFLDQHILFCIIKAGGEDRNLMLYF